MKKRLLSLLAISLMIATTIQAQVPTNGLVAYYPFSGNANDSSGNGNNGTVSGAKLTTDRFGKANKAFSFDGVSNQIIVPNSPTLSFNNSLSFSFWGKLDSLVSGIPLHIRDENTAHETSTRSDMGATPFPDYDINNGISGGSVYVKSQIKTDLNWHNFIGVFNQRTNVTTFYIDGKLQGISNVAITTIDKAHLTFGAASYSWGSNQYFKGKIDDIRIYNRIIDSIEIQSLYHESGYANNNSTIPTNGLVAYYPFSGNAIDSSGNGNNGTVSGAKLTTDRFGNANKAFSFDGVSNQIVVPNSPTLSFNNSISFSFWGKLDSLASGIPLHIRDNNTSHETSTRSDMGATPFPDYDINNGISGGSVYVKSQIRTDLNWHNFIGVFNQSTNVTTFYIDGKLQGTSNVAITTIDKAHLTFGAASYSWGSNQYFKGKIDDIRVYNRTLDSSEVQALYHEGGYNGNNLPVSISNFVAFSKINKIEINFKTATENNNSKFIIQHSTESDSFTDIGSIKAIGIGANNYVFTDDNPVNGINYYRLENVDKNGSSTFSKVVCVKFGDIQTFSIAPNPAKDFATINFSKTVDKATIAVYDLTGKQVITQLLSGNINTYKLNTQSLKSGLYVIKVNTVTGNNNEKLLINK